MGPSPVRNQDKGGCSWWRPLLYRFTIYVLAYPFVLLDPCFDHLAVGPPPFESWNIGKDPWLRSQLFRWRIYILEDPFVQFTWFLTGEEWVLLPSIPNTGSETHDQETGLCIKHYSLHICHSSQEQRIGPWKAFWKTTEQIGGVKKMEWFDHVDVTPPFSHGVWCCLLRSTPALPDALSSI